MAAVAILGWIVAVVLAVYVWRHRCPVDPPTRAVLLNISGLPESIRSCRGPLPKTYTRNHGKQPPTVYAPAGTAAVYQATAPRQG